MTSDTRQVDEALIRRIEAAILSAGVSREAVEFDWPECHRKNCQGHHGNVDSAFATIQIAILNAVKDELRYEVTTRPDFSSSGDSQEEAAAMSLAVLLGRYNVHDAGTYIKAARLLVDAYPAFVDVLAAKEAA